MSCDTRDASANQTRRQRFAYCTQFVHVTARLPCVKVIGRPCVDVDAIRGFLKTISPVDLDGSGNKNSWTRFLARKISHKIFWWSQLQLLRGVVFFLRLCPDMTHLTLFCLIWLISSLMLANVSSVSHFLVWKSAKR